MAERRRTIPEKVARQVLLSFGASRALASALTSLPLKQLPRLTTDSRYFRGTLGGAGGAGAPLNAAKPATPRRARKRQRVAQT